MDEIVLLVELKLLREERDKLRQALRPFAEWAKEWPHKWSDGMPVDVTDTESPPSVGDCRRAAKLLDHVQVAGDGK